MLTGDGLMAELLLAEVLDGHRLAGEAARWRVSWSEQQRGERRERKRRRRTVGSTGGDCPVGIRAGALGH